MHKSCPFFIFLLMLAACKMEVTTVPQDPGENVLSQNIPVKSDYEDINGNPVALHDFKGKRVILNYWATWCRPCIAEMPSMLRAQEMLGRNDYVFVLASDQDWETIKGFQQRTGYGFTFLKFNGSLAAQQIHALPASFIYNSAGDFQFRVAGARTWDAPENIEELKNIP